jgi:CheY-like chemotaxis protein
MMPIMDGRTFLQECGGLPCWARVPVVVLSAAYRVQGSARELGPNVRATLAKPFDLLDVLALVECLTRRTVS